MRLTFPSSSLSIGAALAASMGQTENTNKENQIMIQNIPMSVYDTEGFDFRRKPTRVEKIAFPRDQRKRRKNNRRAFAAGDEQAFNK